MFLVHSRSHTATINIASNTMALRYDCHVCSTSFLPYGPYTDICSACTMSGKGRHCAICQKPFRPFSYDDELCDPCSQDTEPQDDVKPIKIEPKVMRKVISKPKYCIDCSCRLTKRATTNTCSDCKKLASSLQRKQEKQMNKKYRFIDRDVTLPRFETTLSPRHTPIVIGGKPVPAKVMTHEQFETMLYREVLTFIKLFVINWERVMFDLDAVKELPYFLRNLAATLTGKEYVWVWYEMHKTHGLKLYYDFISDETGRNNRWVCVRPKLPIVSTA